QRRRERQEDAQRLVRQHHPDDLDEVVLGVPPPVELRLAGARRVLDRHVLHGVAVREEGHRDRRDAREALRQEVEVLAGHVGAERAQAGVQVRDRRLDQIARELPDDPLGRDAQQLLRPLLRRPRPDDLVVAVELLDEPRDLVVRVGHVGVRPDDDTPACGTRAGTARGSRPAVLREDDEADVPDVAELVRGAVARAVVDHEDLVAVRRRVERGPDPVDLRPDVAALVEDGQHDGHVDRGAGRRVVDRAAVQRTGEWRGRRQGLPTLARRTTRRPGDRAVRGIEPGRVGPCRVRSAAVTAGGAHGDAVRRTGRRFALWLSLICAVGLGVRIAFVLLLRQPHMPFPGDSFIYSASANLVADGKGFVEPFSGLLTRHTVPTASHPPLYILWLAVAAFVDPRSNTSQLTFVLWS